MAKKGKIVAGFILYPLFIVGFLVLAIGLYRGFSQSNPFPGIPYAEMLAFLPIIPAVILSFRFFSFVKNIFKERNLGKPKSGWSIKTGIFFIIFLFSWAPIVLPVFDHGLNSNHHSVYNTGWNGASKFKGYIEDEGYEVRAAQASLSAIARLNASKVVLVIMGSNRFYNPVAEIPFLVEFFRNGGSVFICHDHGSTQWLLIEMVLASGGATPFAFFTKGVLRDNESYYKDSDFPVIENFASHPTTSGVSRVVLSRASAILGGDFLSLFGFSALGTTSSSYSWVDVNDDGMFDRDDDQFKFPSVITDYLESTVESRMEDLGFVNPQWNAPSGIPLGGYAQTVFTYREAGNTRSFLSCDASLFNNELIDLEGYDNRQFGINIINWLTGGDREYIIVFDEAHIMPELGTVRLRGTNSAAMFGLIVGYVNWLSTNLMFLWIYPFIAIYTLRKYLPKSEKQLRKEREKLEKSRAEEKEEMELEFRTKSFFAQKIIWYRENKKYSEALTLLYRRVQRMINAHLSQAGKGFEVRTVLNLVEKKLRPDISRRDYNRLRAFLNRMEKIRKKRFAEQIKDEEEFRDLFYEMIWASEFFETRR